MHCAERSQAIVNLGMCLWLFIYLFYLFPRLFSLFTCIFAHYLFPGCSFVCSIKMFLNLETRNNELRCGAANRAT